MAGKLRARLLKAVRHPGRALGFAARKAREALLWDRCYAAVREPKVEGGIAQTPDVQAAVVGELRAAGFTTADLSIDVADYHRYVSVARYDRYLDYCAADIARLPEKTLEHYLAAQLLGLGKDDVYIDVGGSDSPA
ncbi:hypothetical protein FJY71_02070, partial [candidate division WOR-3 bacterium]|nr:hypothetical protein [candidate division WOR-3 bacterium]